MTMDLFRLSGPPPVASSCAAVLVERFLFALTRQTLAD